MLLEPNCHRSDVDESMDLEDENKERPKVIEHFSEEVPEDANVWCQVGHGQ